jgi:hypothetical protein
LVDISVTPFTLTPAEYSEKFLRILSPFSRTFAEHSPHRTTKGRRTFFSHTVFSDEGGENGVKKALLFFVVEKSVTNFRSRKFVESSWKVVRKFRELSRNFLQETVLFLRVSEGDPTWQSVNGVATALVFASEAKKADRGTKCRRRAPLAERKW